MQTFIAWIELRKCSMGGLFVFIFKKQFIIKESKYLLKTIALREADYALVQ
jgi:hypothetical protein